MKLKILLPYRVFAEVEGVLRLVVETDKGSYGFLPKRLDCVAVLVPGILSYQTASGPEEYVAVDGGVLVKAGWNVLVSVRNAIGGADLGELKRAVEEEFRNLGERETSVRTVLEKLESGFVRRFMELNRE